MSKKKMKLRTQPQLNTLKRSNWNKYNKGTENFFTKTV